MIYEVIIKLKQKKIFHLTTGSTLEPIMSLNDEVHFRLFIYSTSIDTDGDSTNIWLFGLDEESNPIAACVYDFTPYVYIQLPINIRWTEDKIKLLMSKINSKIPDAMKPILKSFMYKKKLYYANINELKYTQSKEIETIKYPYVFLSFAKKEYLKVAISSIGSKLYIPSIGIISLSYAEANADIYLQFTCVADIPSVGWIEGKGNLIEDKETICNIEYLVEWKNIKRSSYNKPVFPLFLSFDIEVNASNKVTMPNGGNPADKVFQISCVLSKHTNQVYERYLLTLGDADTKILNNGIGEDTDYRETQVISFKTEADLLIGFASFIREKRPQVIIGYNIFGFDYSYMYERAKLNFCTREFCSYGYLLSKGPCDYVKKEWSSSAYKNQSFSYIDADGIITVDMLPVIRRDYVSEFSSFRLKVVAEYFLGQTKDPLNHQDIFLCYRMFTPESLAIVGRYCVQDSFVTLKIYEKLAYWDTHIEMANVCNIQVPDLFLRGTQIRAYSQLYRYVFNQNIVVETPEKNANEMKYKGATVLSPNSGLYTKIVSLDFASLYPTIIIAYNIDYTTAINEAKEGKFIKDEDCNVFEWEEHVNCEHVKPTSEKKIICEKFRFRFIKKIKGVLPSLVEYLLDARAKTRKQIKQLKKELEEIKDSDKIIDLSRLITSLDKRQLAYKISANSIYGGLGTGTGYLPFRPAAMCITNQGRNSIMKAAEYIAEKHNAYIIYGDTDSTYVQFKGISNTYNLWDKAIEVEKDIANLFPPPMKLTFEEKIYDKFMSLTKKRYMATIMDKEGNISKTILKKGVMLARRDNCKFVRDTYEKVTMAIFNDKDKKEVINILLDAIELLFTRRVEVKDLVITKSVKNLSDYKAKILPLGDSERKEKLQKKGCQDDDEYRLKCLPGHVQLAERIKKRGYRIDPGSRIEYVITVNGDPTLPQYDKVEDYNYFLRHQDILRIDPYCYLKLMITQFDQLLIILDPKLHKMMDSIHKLYLKKYKVQKEMISLICPIVYQVQN
jgi:DNA polymerase elongation subunit (family B)